ncbi:hypothetical protein XENTR_v10001216 [Xenopus tropicalis]|nr:hypothetical protein XENTR_v10001216 [Xenopus tropicalis]
MNGVMKEWSGGELDHTAKSFWDPLNNEMFFIKIYTVSQFVSYTNPTPENSRRWLAASIVMSDEKELLKNGVRLTKIILQVRCSRMGQNIMGLIPKSDV